MTKETGFNKAENSKKVIAEALAFADMENEKVSISFKNKSHKNTKTRNQLLMDAMKDSDSLSRRMLAVFQILDDCIGISTSEFSDDYPEHAKAVNKILEDIDEANKHRYFVVEYKK